jgi:hypothetical protein
MSTCHRIDELRDYAFDELGAESRHSMEQHIAGCSDCGSELDGLRLTTAALRILPDREIPQRIAFVSDKIFQPSPARRWFEGFWNSGARLGFASACVLAVAIVVSAYHRSAPVNTAAPAMVQTAAAPALSKAPVLSKEDLSKEIDAAVAKAAVQIREEDARTMKTALEESELKHDRERRAMMVAVGENLDFMQKRLNSITMASNDLGVRP